jgi:hypothetical protein
MELVRAMTAGWTRRQARAGTRMDASSMELHDGAASGDASTGDADASSGDGVDATVSADASIGDRRRR